MSTIELARVSSSSGIRYDSHLGGNGRRSCSSVLVLFHDSKFQLCLGCLDWRRGYIWRPSSRIRRVIPRACRDDMDGSQVATKAGCPSTQAGTRRNPCKILKSSNKPCAGLAVAARYAFNDAMFMTAAAHNMDERARSDLFILARGILSLDSRARQGVALLGSGLSKLDARVREDAEKIDVQTREKVERLRHIMLGLKESALLEAEEHWSDGALDADLRLADLRARRRAMEDAYVSVQAVKNVHDALVKILRQKRASELKSDLDRTQPRGAKRLENRNRWPSLTDIVSREQLIALEDAYRSMSSLVVDTDVIDYTDPDEVELIVATLLDMDDLDGGSGASLVAECANSPDVATRRALADALADAPSLWTLGNAGMGALQRLAEDTNSAVASAASKAIEDLRKQWKQEDQDTFWFQVDTNPPTNSDAEDESAEDF